MNLIEVFTCQFSPCRAYRYRLETTWGNGNRRVNFLMLNPSTADEIRSDPTITRCMGYARDWGYDGLIVTNLFALRATDPRVMRAHKEPIGPDNDLHIGNAAKDAMLVILACGIHGDHLGRYDGVLRNLVNMQGRAPLKCLGKTKDGRLPKHPLYLRKDLQPVFV